MRDFINQFGKENLTIIAIVILIILITLVLIVLLEKRKTSKSSTDSADEKNIIEKETLKRPGKHIDYKPLEALRNLERMEDTLKYSKVEANKKIDDNAVNPTYYQKPEPNRAYNYENKKENHDFFEEKSHSEEDVVYKKNTITPEEAKEKLEEVTKKLVENQSEKEHTVFEEEQEEKSIISYEELVNASKNIDEKNDKLLEDEKSAAITLDELYKKEKQDITVKRTVPEFNGTNRTGVISPVFGRRDMRKMNENNNKYKEIVSNNSDDFLKKLKDFRNKLD